MTILQTKQRGSGKSIFKWFRKDIGLKHSLKIHHLEFWVFEIVSQIWKLNCINDNLNYLLIKQKTEEDEQSIKAEQAQGEGEKCRTGIKPVGHKITAESS